MQSLRLAPERDETLIPHSGQMLRQRRLTQINVLLQCANRHFIVLNQQTEDQQTLFVAHQAKQIRRFADTFLHEFLISRVQLQPHQLVLTNLELTNIVRLNIT